MKRSIFLPIFALFVIKAVSAPAAETAPAPQCDIAVAATGTTWGVEFDVSNWGSGFCPATLTIQGSAFRDVRLYGFAGDECDVRPDLDVVVCNMSMPAAATASVLVDTGGAQACVTASSYVVPIFFTDGFAANNQATACARNQRVPFSVLP